MLTRLAGAILRAILVVVLIAIPSLMLPGTPSDMTQTVALVALLAALFTVTEYVTDAPSLVEFRDAPPFNRIRFVALFFTILTLTLILRGRVEPTTLTQLAQAAGTAVGELIDFPYSPVRLLVLMLPDGADAALVSSVRTAAGISYLISLGALGAFVLILRMGDWPGRGSDFNVWVNMPTFDPAAGGDVVDRLNCDAAVNLILGFLLPFLIPAFVKLASDVIDPISLANDHTLIWTTAAWAFLPASLLMRGMALGRVAEMIHRQRARAVMAGDRQAVSHA